MQAMSKNREPTTRKASLCVNNALSFEMLSYKRTEGEDYFSVKTILLV